MSVGSAREIGTTEVKMMRTPPFFSVTLSSCTLAYPCRILRFLVDDDERLRTEVPNESRKYFFDRGGSRLTMEVYDADERLVGSGSLACEDSARKGVELTDDAGTIVVEEIKFEELTVWSNKDYLVCTVDAHVFEIDRSNSKFTLPLGTNLVIGGEVSWAIPLAQLRPFRSYTLDHEDALITISVRQRDASCVAFSRLRVNFQDCRPESLVAVMSLVQVDDFADFVPHPPELPKASYQHDTWDVTSPMWQRRPTLYVSRSPDDAQEYCWDDDVVEFNVDPNKSVACIEFYDNQHSRIAYGLLKIPSRAGNVAFSLAAGVLGQGTVNVETKEVDQQYSKRKNCSVQGNDECPCESANCRSRFASLEEEVACKQISIDRLATQVEEQSDALRGCDVEIARLKSAVEELRLEKNGQSIEMGTRRHDDHENLAKELKRKSRGGDDAKKLRILSGMYEKLRAENISHLEAARRRKEESREIENLRASYHRLQKAHAAQAAHMLKFQSDRSQIDTYKSTIATQEDIIRRLEHVVDEKVREICRQRKTEVEAAREEIARVKAEEALAVDSLTTELRHQELKAQELKMREVEHEKEAREKEDEARRRDALVARETANSASTLESNLDNVRALEERLVANATESGREIARLNLRIFELETLANNKQQSEQAPDIYVPAYW